MSDSEPSDYEPEPVAETAVYYKTTTKGGANRHHVPGEAELSKTACPLRLVIANLVAVTLPVNAQKRDTFFCSRCVKARPTLFPASAVADIFPERAAQTGRILVKGAGPPLAKSQPGASAASSSSSRVSR